MTSDPPRVKVLPFETVGVVIFSPGKKWVTIVIYHLAYYPILHEWMDKYKRKSKFKDFWIWLDIGCSSTIVTRQRLKKLKPKEDAAMQWDTQAGNITTKLKFKIDFTLPEISAEKLWLRNFI